MLVEYLPLAAITSETEKATFNEAFSALSQQSVEDLSRELAQQKLCGIKLEMVNETPLCWWCTCSQQKTEQILCSLGIVELRSLLAEQGGALCDITVFAMKNTMFLRNALGS